MKFEDINWYSGSFILIYHVLLFITLPMYLFYVGWPSLGMILATLFLYVVFGIGITAGYHRLYAHKSYKTTKVVDFVLLLLGTTAIQNRVLNWSADHRMHHRFVDTNKDPYSIKKGFWYAHVIWIFEKRPTIDKKAVVPDLLKNKLIVLQDKYYTFLVVFLNLLVFLLFGLVFNDFFGAFVFGLLARTFLIHHSTWFINSMAHYWGAKTYSKEFSAVDNYIVALLTLGEGYHNYHHTFTSDYRNGISWYHFDPTKWFVWSLSKLGLVHGLIKVNSYSIKRKLVQEDKRLMLAKIRESVNINKEMFETKVNELSQRIHAYIASIRRTKEAVKAGRQNNIGREKLAQLRSDLKTQIRELRSNWRTWCRLTKNVMRPNPSLG